MDALRATDQSVVLADQVNQPLFSVKGQSIQLDLQDLAFPDVTKAEI